MKTSAYLEELKSLTVADLQSQLVDAKGTFQFEIPECNQSVR